MKDQREENETRRREKAHDIYYVYEQTTKSNKYKLRLTSITAYKVRKTFMIQSISLRWFSELKLLKGIALSYNGIWNFIGTGKKYF